VDWHVHANAYFTLLLEGRLVDLKGSKQQLAHPGEVLFQPWGEAHANTLISKHGHGFHVEIEPIWFDQYDLRPEDFLNPSHRQHPILRVALHRLRQALLEGGGEPQVVIDALLLEGLCLGNPHKQRTHKVPSWVPRLRERLQEESLEQASLGGLAAECGIHPVHLSRSFTQYFGMPLGAYVRTLRVDRAMQMMLKRRQGLAAIAQDCGFCDQSHMVKAFRRVLGATPSAQLQSFPGTRNA
jgi:AraC family transcriptional regulator